MSAVAIHEKLMAVRLNCSFSFGRVTDKAITHEINAAKGTAQALQARKELFPQDSGLPLKALQSQLSEFYQYHQKKTMSAVNDGERLLPVPFYMEYMGKYGEAQVQVQEKFDAFVNSYDNCVRHAQQLLGPAFNADDYPDKDKLEQILKFRLQTLPLPVANTLLHVVGESVQADVDAYVQQALRQAMDDVNTRMREGLARMTRQLSNPKGKVYASLTDSLLDLVEAIPTFNVTQDDSLTLLAKEVKEKLLGHDTETLRNDPLVRQSVAAEAADILRRMG